MKNGKNNFWFSYMTNFEVFHWNFSLSTNPQIVRSGFTWLQCQFGQTCSGISIRINELIRNEMNNYKDNISNREQHGRIVVQFLGKSLGFFIFHFVFVVSILWQPVQNNQIFHNGTKNEYIRGIDESIQTSCTRGIWSLVGNVQRHLNIDQEKCYDHAGTIIAIWRKITKSLIGLNIWYIP